LNASAIGAEIEIDSYGTIKLKLRQTPQYRIVTIPNEPIIPLGKSREGCRTSSLNVHTSSQPIQQKNARPDPLKTPKIPNGSKGSKFSIEPYLREPNTEKTIIRVQLMTTRMKEIRVLSWIPKHPKIVQKKFTPTANPHRDNIPS
jgi:hypothetical protein